MDELFHIGIDVGSTTVKVVVLNNSNNIVHKEYRRHYSDVKKSVKEVLNEETEFSSTISFANPTGL